MATLQEHRAKALHNEKFVDVHNLRDGEFVGWAVTVLFYGALHWMRALASQEGFQIRSYSGKAESGKLALRQVPLFKNSPRQFTRYRRLKGCFPGGEV